MAEISEERGGENGQSDIRSKLIKRLMVAGALVASLLGMLAFFDYLATAPEEPEAPVFTRPVPVVPRKETSQPVTPATNLPEPPATIVSEPVLDVAPAPLVEAQPSPRVEAVPKLSSENGLLMPSTAANTRAPLSAHLVPAPARPHSPVPEATESPTVRVEPEQAGLATLPAKPSARVLEAKTAQSPWVVPTPQRLFAGFVVQAGVFSSVQRAEELHAKLSLGGIQSSLETRVQLGPFSTRQEAEAAQTKLKELGFESILVPLKGSRN